MLMMFDPLEERSTDVRPEDSVSQASGRTSSSTRSALRFAAAKRASLAVEAEALLAKQNLAMQLLEIQQRQEMLEIRTEIAKTAAEERILAEPFCGDETMDETRDNTRTIRADANRTSEEQPVFSSTQALINAIQLPKTDMIKFNGDPLQYWVFIRTFENNVERVTDDSSARLTRLLQACQGKAYRIVQCCAVMEPEDGYRKARHLLKERFGNDYVITEAWIDKIRAMPSVKANDSESLQNLADNLKTCQETLHAMKKLHELDTQRSLVDIVEKLPFHLQKRWQKIVRDIRKRDERSPSITDLVGFVNIASEEANDPVFGKFTDKRDNRSTKPKDKTFSMYADGSDDSRKAPKPNSGGSEGVQYQSCPLCSQRHNLFGCDAFKGMNPTERFKFTREKRLCDNCLKPGHMAHRCQRTTTCTVPDCGKKHTKFIHIPTSDRNSRETQVNNSMQVNNNSTVCTLTGAGQRIALPVVPVRVLSPDNQNVVETFALLDTGSTNTFCSQQLFNDLQISGQADKLLLTTLDRENSVVNTAVCSLDITDLSSETVVHLPRVYSSALPIQTEVFATQSDLDRWPHLSGIKLPYIGEKRVDLLIGQDVPEALVPLEVRQGSPGEPYATRTIFGWCLGGPIGFHHGHRAISNFVHADYKLDRQVEKFWQTETSESLVDDKIVSVEDKRALTVWEKTIKLEDGHYKLAIPVKQNPPHMPNNRQMALHRLQLLGKRLKKDPKLEKMYNDGISDLLECGYAKKAAELAAADAVVWYLPHHPVFHPQKPDRVRIVFDCAAKCRGTSLNDQILQGPDLTNSLVGVLLRFREHPIAVMADIQSMFHQVHVNDDQCNLLRFLWWPDNDQSQAPEDYQMVVHIFGGVWSPSCVNFALKQTAHDNRQSFHDVTVQTVHRNFYVDDCLKSVETEHDAIVLVQQLTELLSLGGFKLTKWISNSREVLNTVPEPDRAKEVKDLVLEEEKLPVGRALGVHWDAETDTLGFRTEVKDKARTKRGLLSTIASVYDPHGFACPFILPAKQIFQELCRKHIDWDESLPGHELEQWIRWLDDLPTLCKFSLKRCLKPDDFGSIVSCQLHHFSDASEKGYGTVTYLRIVNSRGQIHCSFVMAKSRLAPIKPMTIPRLELSAATVAVKVDKMLRRELDVSVHESYFWTDSTIVLQYVMNEGKRFHTFVANRVAVIHDASTPSQWHHVDTASNPADDVSRGLTADQLINSSRWFRGPDFLWHSEEEWPQMTACDNLKATDNLEIKKKPVLAYAVANDEDSVGEVLDRIMHKYSSWYKLKRSVAWLLRCRVKLRNRAKQRKNDTETLPEETGDLTVKEIRAAEQQILLYIQRRAFPKELHDGIKKGSPLYNLQPVQVSNGLLCLGGRLQNAPVSEHSRHQIILPKHHHIVDLIIEHYHRVCGHSGREHVLALIRERYWIIKARNAVRRILKDCFSCRRRTARPAIQQMASLPEGRVTPDKPPFSFVGVDYFGPYMVKRGRSLVKRYGCIFTCLVTRAIHIEVAHTLDTSSFLNALQRFVSRRGQPVEIRSDNGTNFVGGERELREAIEHWNMKQIDNYLVQRSIQWKFNTPAASHMGGAWERMIRSIRKVLGALTNEQTLDDESLVTFMCQVEGIINSRPLTWVSDDPKDPEPLTPNHLLLLRSGPVLPPGLFVKTDCYSKRRWRQVQYMADTFWRRWTKEYLPSLQKRQKWLHPYRNLKEGDIVLVVDENTPRGLWPLARIEQTFPGKDGLVRTVRVKTRATSLTRPIDKLCLLEAVERSESEIDI